MVQSAMTICQLHGGGSAGLLASAPDLVLAVQLEGSAGALWLGLRLGGSVEGHHRFQG